MKKRVLIISVAILAILFMLTVALLSREPKQTPVPAATPTVDPLAADRALLKDLSNDFAEKYKTFAKADDPAYFKTIQPSMTKESFDEMVAENRRYAGRAPFLMPIRSKALSNELELESAERAAAKVTLESVDLPDGKPYEQVLAIKWVKRDGRWLVDDATMTRSSKEYPDG